MIAAILGVTSSPLQVTPNETLPQYVTDLFKEHHFDQRTLPTLDLKSDRTVNYMHPLHLDSPVMLIKGETIKGLALHVRLQEGKSLPFLKPNHGSVLAIFAEDGLWKANNHGTLQYAMQERHGDVYHLKCDACPFREEEPISKEVLLNLFTGMDPDFQLGEDSAFKLFQAAPKAELSIVNLFLRIFGF